MKGAFVRFFTFFFFLRKFEEVFFFFFIVVSKSSPVTFQFVKIILNIYTLNIYVYPSFEKK